MTTDMGEMASAAAADGVAQHFSRAKSTAPDQNGKQLQMERQETDLAKQPPQQQDQQQNSSPEELAELEALADELNAAATSQEEDEEGAAAAVRATEAAPLVSQCWEAAYDHNAQRYYYFNRATGVSQWHLPPDWVPDRHKAPRPGAAPAAAAALGPSSSSSHPAGAAPAGPGFWYRDAFGMEQGPFSKQQLVQWRGVLPMDLQLVHAASGRPTAAERQRPVLLAEVLEDTALLARWREEHAVKLGQVCMAPPAALYEQDMQKDTATSLAEAVLAGLPANDEAVQVARLAACTGKSIQEVIEWNHKQSDYISTALHSSGRGRIQATDGQPESLYSEYGNWLNPNEVEDQLRAAAQRRKRPLTAEELRAIKQRKQEHKEKKMRAWLST